MSCRSCNYQDLEIILDLGNQPWCNHLLNNLTDTEITYPLRLVYCKKCELLQLDYTVPKEIMFIDHGYRSGITETLKNHFYEIAKENISMFNLKSEDLIIDIGGNDGTQLLQYKKLGINKLINFESATLVSKISQNAGIPTINAFFSEDTAKKYIPEGSAKIINAAGVFFHLEDLHGVIKGIDYALADSGIFNVQCMYANEIIKQGTYDMIYHEHLCYYTMKSLHNLLAPYGFSIFDAYHSDIHSGSLILRICKNNFYPKTDRYFEMLKEESKYSIEHLKTTCQQIKNNRGKIKQFLLNLKQQNKTIYAYGSPAKGCTLLNYEGIDNTIITKAVEVNQLKINKILPMSHIPIVEENINDIPDYYLLLSHNFKEEIMRKNDKLLKKGVKFIIPFPQIKVL